MGRGVGTAISAFAPVYASLNSGGFWSLGKSVSPEDMVSGIESITDGYIALGTNLQIKTFDPKNALMSHGVRIVLHLVRFLQYLDL
jgi:hypothetical protein